MQNNQNKPEPSAGARERAEKIVTDHLGECVCRADWRERGRIDPQCIWHQGEAKHLIDAIAAAMNQPVGSVRFPDGRDVKVNGDFKFTNDGAIACEGGTCWCVYFHVGGDEWRVSKCRRSGHPEDYGCWWEVDDCESDGVDIRGVYSTEEAAIAALAIVKNAGGEGETNAN